MTAADNAGMSDANPRDKSQNARGMSDANPRDKSQNARGMSEANPRDNNQSDRLCQEILGDASKQAERIRRRAGREAGEFVAKAKVEAQKARDQRLAEAAAQAQRARDLILARVGVEVGRMRAARTEQVLCDCLDAARKRLAERGGFDYGDRLAALAAEAIGGMAGRRFVLELGAADLAAFAARLPGEVLKRAAGRDIEVTVLPEPAKIGAGVIVRDADGRQVWDDSFEARLERLWPELRLEIARRLEDKQPEAGEGA